LTPFREKKQYESIECLLATLWDKEKCNPVLNLDKHVVARWPNLEYITAKPWYKKVCRVFWLSGLMVFDSYDQYHCFHPLTAYWGHEELGLKVDLDEQKQRLEKRICVLQEKKEQIQEEIDGQQACEPVSLESWAAKDQV